MSRYYSVARNSGMTLNDTIKLIGYTTTEDADGYETKVETLTEVKCDSQNGVARTEFYDAMKVDIELTASFEMWACDYGGQKELIHNGKRYKVVRAFPMNDGVIQLNCAEVKR